MLGGRSRRSGGDLMGVDTRGLCQNRGLRCIALLSVGAVGLLVLWSFLLPSEPTPNFPLTPSPALGMGELHEVRTTLSQHKSDISALQQTIAHLQGALQEATSRLAAVPSSQRLDAQESEIKASLLSALQKSIHGQIDDVSVRADASLSRLDAVETQLALLHEDWERMQQASRLQDTRIVDVETQLIALSLGSKDDGTKKEEKEKEKDESHVLIPAPGKGSRGQESSRASPSAVPVPSKVVEKKKPSPVPVPSKAPWPSPVLLETLSAPEEVDLEDDNTLDDAMEVEPITTQAEDTTQNLDLITTEEDEVDLGLPVGVGLDDLAREALISQTSQDEFLQDAGDQQELNLEAPETEQEQADDLDDLEDLQDEEDEEYEAEGKKKRGEHVVVIIPDLGAFADRFSAGALKLGACSPEFTSNEASVDKVLASIEAIDDLREESTRTLTILLATTPTRASAFEVLDEEEGYGVEIVYADDGLGYGDLCNEAVEEVDDEDATLVFLMPGAVPTTLDFFDTLVDPLYHESYDDVGIVMAKAVDFWSGMLAHAGTHVYGSEEDAIPYLQHRGTWPNDERTHQAQFVPVASPYGAWAIPVSVYRAVGGMLSDRDISYTPSLAVYDLCLAVAKEADHEEEEDDASLDDDDTGVCALQERHRVFYQPTAVVEVQLEACEEALLALDRHSEERRQFQDRWASFLWERYVAPQRELDLVVGWDLAAEGLAYCHDAVLTLTALGNSAATRVVPPTGTLCAGQLSSEGQSMLTLLRDADAEKAARIDVIVTPIQPTDVREHTLQPILRQAGEPRFHVARVLEWGEIELDEDMREGLEAYDQVWVATPAMRASLLAQGLSSSRTHVVPLPVDTYFFDANAMEALAQVPVTERALLYLSDPSQMVLLPDLADEWEASEALQSIQEVTIYAPSLATQGRSVAVERMGEAKVQVIKEKLSLRELAQLYATSALYVPLQPRENESAEERLFRLQAQSMGVPVWNMEEEERPEEEDDTLLLRPHELQTILLELLQQLEQ